MFFQVNRGRLKIKAIGDKPIEHVAITIRDADDQVIFEGNSVGNKEMTVVADVPSDLIATKAHVEFSTWAFFCLTFPFENVM